MKMVLRTTTRRLISPLISCRLLIAAAALLTSALTVAQSNEISIREYGRYRSAGSEWVILVVPAGTTSQQLVRVAANLHSATPEVKYEFFDATDKELARYLNYNQHDGARGTVY